MRNQRCVCLGVLHILCVRHQAVTVNTNLLQLNVLRKISFAGSVPLGPLVVPKLKLLVK